MNDEAIQKRYAQALHRATKPGARLYMFEFSPHNVNSIQWSGIPADNFQRVLGFGGWRVDYVGDTALVPRFLPQTLEAMTLVLSEHHDEMRAGMQRLTQQLDVLGPLLQDQLVHLPAWSVIATRLDLHAPGHRDHHDPLTGPACLLVSVERPRAFLRCGSAPSRPDRTGTADFRRRICAAQLHKI